MQIGIDASRAFLKVRTGTENYSYQLLRAIARMDCQQAFRLYLRPDFTGKDDTLTSVFRSTVINMKFGWTQIGLASETWKNSNLDLLFVPAHVIPFFKRINLPTIVTIHDLRTEFLPQGQNVLQKFYLNSIMERLRADIATRVIAVSEATKIDIIDRLNVRSDKIDVIYEGVDTEFFDHQKGADTERINEVSKKYGIGKQYLFFVGTIQPRKNLVRLIKSFSKLGELYRDYELVIAGNKGWLADEIYSTPAQLGLHQRVKFLNYVDNDDLPYLYAGANLFVFPSLYEGFGLPVLESYAMGTPVLTSRIASLPEVGGEFATYVNPYDETSITSGIESALNKPSSKADLVGWASRFSWEESARRTIELFERVINKKICVN